MLDKKKTIYTKKRLQFTFSVIVFFVVFLLSLLFLCSIYFWTRYQQYHNFSIITQSIEDKKISLDTISHIWEESKDDDKRFNENLSYIVVNNNTITSEKLNSEFTKEEIQQIMGQDIGILYQTNKFYSKWISLNNSKIYIISRINYTFESLAKDIFVAFLVSLFSAWVFFFLLWKYINKLFLPVEENIANMNDFIHNAWHELQTPLSVIMSNIDFYMDNKKGNDFILWEIKDETKKMSELIKSLLRISKEDYQIHLEEFRVKDFINEITDNFEEKRRQKNIVIQIYIEDDVKIIGNRKHLSICMTNILWNAIKYNRDNGIVEIYCDTHSFVVKDSGIGISKENINKIFDRFYKEDSSRSTEGFWIWLSLVKKLCHLNNWKYLVQSEKNHWTCFTIQL